MENVVDGSMNAKSFKRFDIPNPSSYSIKYLSDIISKWVDNDKLDLDPDFQRGHVWTMEQRILFLEYWMQGGTINPIYLNWPALKNPVDHYQDFTIVDGKQRLTTFLMFANNEITIFNNLKFKDFISTTFPSIHIATNTLGTKKEVLEWYILFNSGGTPHTKEEIERVKNLMING